MSRRIQDLVSAAVFAVLGTAFLITGRNLPITARDIPGPGLFPLMLAALTVLLALLLAVTVFRAGPAKQPTAAEAPAESAVIDLGPPTEFEDADDTASQTRPLLVWGAVLACALLLPVAGFLVSTLLLMVIVIVVVERRRDLPSLITIVALPLACYGLFAVLLDVRLPTGFFG